MLLLHQGSLLWMIIAGSCQAHDGDSVCTITALTFPWHTELQLLLQLLHILQLLHAWHVLHLLDLLNVAHLLHDFNAHLQLL